MLLCAHQHSSANQTHYNHHMPHFRLHTEAAQAWMGFALLLSLILCEYERKDASSSSIEPLIYEGESEEEVMLETSWGMA